MCGIVAVVGSQPAAPLLLEAVQAVLPQLQGAYALAVVWAEAPGALVVARKAAPLMIGLGEGEFLCASDTPALAGFTRTILPNGIELCGQLKRPPYWESPHSQS